VARLRAPGESMATQKPKTGGEIDAYCTKCRLDLNHRVVAMVGDTPKRVECSTCGTQHNYYKPKGLGAVPKAAKGASGSTPPASTKAPGKGSASAKAVAAAQAENARERTWEKAVSGKPVTSFKAFRISSSFGEGELIHHTKFGDGYVVRVLDKTKIEVMFKDGPRTLAHGVEGA
jgi:hypothetical protein